MSGINAGENIGATIPVSGTVGAARTAARNGVRALAVSQGNPKAPDYAAGARQAVAWVKQHRRGCWPLGRPRPATSWGSTTSTSRPARRVRSAAWRRCRSRAAASQPADCTSTLQHPKDDVEAFANGFASLSAMQSTAVCSRFHDASDPAAMLDDPVLNEVSGVAASRVNPPALWVHNDSGGEPTAYAISPTGKMLGAYPVDGATAVDWEDIAVGPGPKQGTSYLYLGDIGDNASERNPITVYRVPEPTGPLDGTGATLTGTEKFSLRYPDGPVDAESLIVDPQSGDLFIIDKEYTSGIGKVFRAREEPTRRRRRHHARERRVVHSSGQRSGEQCHAVPRDHHGCRRVARRQRGACPHVSPRPCLRPSEGCAAASRVRRRSLLGAPG